MASDNATKAENGDQINMEENEDREENPRKFIVSSEKNNIDTRKESTASGADNNHNNYGEKIPLLAPNKFPLLCIFYAEFDNIVGPTICEDAPKGFMELDIQTSLKTMEQTVKRYLTTTSEEKQEEDILIISQDAAKRKNDTVLTDNHSSSIFGSCSEYIIPNSSELLFSNSGLAVNNLGNNTTTNIGRNTSNNGASASTNHSNKNSDSTTNSIPASLVQNRTDGGVDFDSNASSKKDVILSSSFEESSHRHHQNSNNKTAETFLTLTTHQMQILSRPTLISDSNRYERNSFLFSIGFVLRKGVDPRLFQPILNKVASTLKDMEMESRYLSQYNKENSIGRNSSNNSARIQEKILKQSHQAHRNSISASSIERGQSRTMSLGEMLRNILLHLNSIQSECNIVVDNANQLNLKLFLPPTARVFIENSTNDMLSSAGEKRPGKSTLSKTSTYGSSVPDYVVPVLLKPEFLIQSFDWDLTISWLVPHINGINHVKQISSISEVDLEMVKACLSVLKVHNVLRFVDVFSYGNYYESTDVAHELLSSLTKQTQTVFKNISHHVGGGGTGNASSYTHDDSGTENTTKSASSNNANAKTNDENQYELLRLESSLKLFNQAFSFASKSFTKTNHSSTTQFYSSQNSSNNQQKQAAEFNSNINVINQHPIRNTNTIYNNRLLNALVGSPGRRLSMKSSHPHWRSQYYHKLGNHSIHSRPVVISQHQQQYQQQIQRTQHQQHQYIQAQYEQNYQQSQHQVAPTPPVQAHSTHSNDGESFAPRSYPPSKQHYVQSISTRQQQQNLSPLVSSPMSNTTPRKTMDGNQSSPDTQNITLGKSNDDGGSTIQHLDDAHQSDHNNRHAATIRAQNNQQLHLQQQQQQQHSTRKEHYLMKIALAQIYNSCNRNSTFGQVLLSKIASSENTDDAQNEDASLYNNGNLCSKDWKKAFDFFDHRRLVTFGMVHGLLKRLHCFPLAVPVYSNRQKSNKKKEKKKNKRSRKDAKQMHVKENEREQKASHRSLSPSFSSSFPSIKSQANRHPKEKKVSTTIKHSRQHQTQQKNDINENEKRQQRSNDNENGKIHEIAKQMDGTKCDDELSYIFQMKFDTLLEIVKSNGSYDIAMIYSSTCHDS